MLGLVIVLSLAVAQADVDEHTGAEHAVESRGEMVGDHDHWPDEGLDADAVEDEVGPELRRRAKRAELDGVSLLGLAKSRDGGPTSVPEGLPEMCVRMWMTRTDMVAFYKLLSSRRVKEYLEYGGGGSTLCASQLVEHGTRRLGGALHTHAHTQAARTRTHRTRTRTRTQ
jgi:hypothetical protein